MSSTESDMITSDSELKKLIKRHQAVEVASSSPSITEKKKNQETTNVKVDIRVVAFEPYRLDKIHWASAPPLLGGKMEELNLKEFQERTNAIFLGSLCFENETAKKDYLRFSNAIKQRLDAKNVDVSSITSETLKKQSRGMAKKIVYAPQKEFGVNTFANAFIKKGEQCLYCGCATLVQSLNAYSASVSVPISPGKFAKFYTDAQNVRDSSGWFPNLPSLESIEEYEFTNYDVSKVATANMEGKVYWLSDVNMFVYVLVAKTDIKKGEIIGFDYGYERGGWSNLNVFPKLVEKTGSVIPVEKYHYKSIKFNIQGLNKVTLGLELSYKELSLRVKTSTPLVIVLEHYYIPFSNQARCAVLEKPETLRKIFEDSHNTALLNIEADVFLTNDILYKMEDILSEKMLECGISQFNQDTMENFLGKTISVPKWRVNYETCEFISEKSFSPQEKVEIGEKLKKAAVEHKFKVDSKGRYLLLIDLSQSYLLAKDKMLFPAKKETQEVKAEVELEGIAQSFSFR